MACSLPNKKANKFFSMALPINPRVVVSRNGETAEEAPAHKGQKPDQRKRKRAHKTRTPAKNTPARYTPAN